MPVLAGCTGEATLLKLQTVAATLKLTTNANAEITGDPVTLKVWESIDGPDEWIKQAGAKFTEKYPNITIEYVNVELGDSTTNIALDGPAGART